MSDDDDFEKDIPKPKGEDEIPAWIKDRNESQRGVGFNPKNARGMTAGSAYPPGEYAPGQDKIQYEPTHEDMKSVEALLNAQKNANPGMVEWLWKQFNDYYWSTKERNAQNSLGKRDDPAKERTYTPEQTDAFNKDRERREAMAKDYQKRNIEAGKWKNFASSGAFAHQGDDTGIEGDR